MPRRLLAELMGLRFLILSKIVAFSAMAILSATFALPVNVYATSLGEASGNIGFVDNSANQISPRMMYEDVLDTYAYYICYSDSSHNDPLLYPTYRQLAFPNSYSRIYPDECTLTLQLSCTDCGSGGCLKFYKCNYRIR